MRRAAAMMLQEGERKMPVVLLVLDQHLPDNFLCHLPLVWPEGCSRATTREAHLGMAYC